MMALAQAQKAELLELTAAAAAACAEGWETAENADEGSIDSQPPIGISFGPFQVVRHLSGPGVAIDFGEAAKALGAYGLVQTLVSQKPALFGGSEGSGQMLADSIVPRKFGAVGGATYIEVGQTYIGLPVFETLIHVVLNASMNIISIDAAIIPERILPLQTEVSDLLLQAAFDCAAECELGWFHGSLWGLAGWDQSPAVLAYRKVEVDEEGVRRIVYSDARDGAPLVSLLDADYHAPVDIYQYDSTVPGACPIPCLALHDPGLPGLPVSLDTQSVCGSGTYPDCQFPGTSADVQQMADAYGQHLLSRFGRDSWDNGQGIASECDLAPDPHRLMITTDWDCCTCNAAFRYDSCSVTICPELASHPDVVGHEFAHGMLRSEELIFAATGHSTCFREGFPDLFGEFFEADVIAIGNDWKAGSSPICLGHRDMAEPHQSTGSMGQVIAYPEHASEFCMDDVFCEDFPPSPVYYNPTILGKLGYLLGRNSALPPESHWGVAVQSLGLAVTRAMFYRVLTGYLTQYSDFSTVRDNLLTDAATVYGSTSPELASVRQAVDAIGFWTSQMLEPFDSSSKVEGALFTVNGENRRYVFGVSNGTIWYRYRTCNLDGRCAWIGPTPAFLCSTGISITVFGNALWLSFDYQGTVWMARMNAAGTWDYLSSISRVTTSVRPELVAVGSSALKVYIREASPLDSDAQIRVAVWDGTNWSTTLGTMFSTRSPLDCVTSGWVSRCFYRNTQNDVTYKSYNHFNAQYGNAVVVPLHALFSGTAFQDINGPTVALYRGRMHVALYDEPSIIEYGIYYGSAPATCDSADCWTRFSHIDGYDEHASNVDWLALMPFDTRLYLMRQDTHLGTRFFSWRWKNSE